MEPAIQPTPELAAKPKLYDMHCHLDFAQDPAALADGLATRGVGGYSVTATPEGFERAQHLLTSSPRLRIGAGLHPWWLADGRCGPTEVAAAERLVETTAFVGEIGLDFARDRAASRDIQVDAFERIVRTCAKQGNKLISIHAVRAADAVLDLLERYRCTEACTCILHWFSGSSEDLNRAIRMNCYFSVGERMVASKRGRAYVRAIPEHRLLLETDLPSDGCSGDDADTLEQSLQNTLEQLEQLRDQPLAHTIASTSKELLAHCEVQ